MKFFTKYFIVILTILTVKTTAFTQLSEQAQISLLTCAEGDEIYSLFGHSAIRVKDPINNIDNCYNWGMFEFDSDEIVFATKFTKGKLKYYMAEQDFESFMWEYDYFQRNVKEQVLNLTFSQKKELWKALKINLLPENSVYKYDFFFDNCSTRIRDLLRKIGGKNLHYAQHPDADNYSLRQLLNHAVKSMPWLSFGMDLALGSKVDVKANNDNLMFLPRYMYEIVADSYVIIDGKKQPFVLKEHTLIEGAERSEIESSWLTPNFVFWSLLVITFLLSMAKIPFLTKFWDGLLLFIFGILGIVILFLWFGTDHQTMRPNYNVLWATPLHLFFIIPLMSKRLFNKLKNIYLGMTILLFLVVFGAMIIPQEFNGATSPIILLLAFKYFYWYKSAGKAM